MVESKKSSGWKKIAVAVVVIIVLGWLGLHFLRGGGASPEMKTFHVKKGLFEVKITETGEIKAIKSILVSAPRIRNKLQIVKLAEEGSMISAGDTLIEFDNSEMQKTVSNMEAELEKTQADLDKARAEKDILILELDKNILQAEIDLAEAENALKKAAGSSRAEREIAEKTVLLRKRNLEIEKKRKKSELEKQKADLRKLQLSVEQAEEELELSKTELAMTVVKAPISGMVVYQKVWKGGTVEKVQEGDTPWPGQGLIRIPNLEKMLVETSVNEVDISKVEKGQRVMVTLDAFPKPPLEAVVTRISTLAKDQPDSESKVYEVTAELKDTRPQIRPGMTATCDIITSSMENRIFVPQIAVFEVDDTTVVYRKVDGRFEAVPVKTGLRNTDMVIIEEGLGDGDEIALRDPNLHVGASEWTDKDSEKKTGFPGGAPSSGSKKRHGKRTIIIN